MAKNIKNLLLFDYDGVVAFNPESFDIMDQALRSTANDFGKSGEELDCRSIFSATSGTTEANLASVTCKLLRINDKDSFLDTFTTRRDSLIRSYQQGLQALKFPSKDQYKGETIYPDFTNLIRKINESPLGRDTLIGLVTGNPGKVMETRLAPRLRNTFKFFITGEQAKTRRELIEMAKEHAQKRGWEPTKDIYGRNTNAFYFDDTQRAILQGIDANVRCVHIPRRLPEPGNMEWGALEKEIVNKYGIATANRLTCGNEVSSPSVFVPYYEHGLSSPFILRDRSFDRSPVFAEGFIDPRSHQEWSRTGEENIRTEFGFDPRLRAGRR